MSACKDSCWSSDDMRLFDLMVLMPTGHLVSGESAV